MPRGVYARKPKNGRMKVPTKGSLRQYCNSLEALNEEQRLEIVRLRAQCKVDTAKLVEEEVNRRMLAQSAALVQEAKKWEERAKALSTNVRTLFRVLDRITK
jgi:hypothetical protein